MTWHNKPYSSLLPKDDITWYGRILLWLASLVAIFVLIILASIGAMVIFSTYAHAKEPAIVTEKGPPASKRTECDAKRRFTEIVIKMRDDGKSIEETTGIILARAISFGVSVDAETIHKSVSEAWAMSGNDKDMGQRIYYLCLDGEGT